MRLVPDPFHTSCRGQREMHLSASIDMPRKRNPQGEPFIPALLSDHLFNHHSQVNCPLRTYFYAHGPLAFIFVLYSPQCPAHLPATVAITTRQQALLAQMALCRPGCPAGSPCPARVCRLANTLRLQRAWPTHLRGLCPDLGPHERRVLRPSRILGSHWITSACPIREGVQ